MADPAHESADSVPATPDEMLDRDVLGSPSSPGSVNSSEASTPLEAPSDIPPTELPKRVPSLRSVSDPQNPGALSPSSTHIGVLNSARRPQAASLMSSGHLPNDLQAKMKAFTLSRQGSGNIDTPHGPPGSRPQMGGSPVTPGSTGRPPMPMAMGNMPGHLQLPTRPGGPAPARSAPSVPVTGGPGAGGMAKRRGLKFNLSQVTGEPQSASPTQPGAEASKPTNGNARSSNFDQFKDYIDAEKGYLTFKGKAIITSKGVDFSDGSVFKMSLDQVEVLDELGKGNYGTVYKVRHAKPRVPRFGPGLSGWKAASTSNLSYNPAEDTESPTTGPPGKGGMSGTVMAMKEMKLELDHAKLGTILKELIILHECVSPYIIDFYGAFFQENSVYMCIEYMDGGSVDKLYIGGIPENVLRKITYSTVMGLKELKDKHKIIHRDVKPTNILINTRGQVKICDFGVSGDLVASMAKTNIGCQSYMAPERIGGGSFLQTGPSDGTYSVQSDIWSLGLTIIECAMGKYPYPPEISATIFSQLSAIVDGEPPDLPTEGYSGAARDFVKGCLNKVPKLRPPYSALLLHPWVADLSKPEAIAEEDEDEHENEEAMTAAANKFDVSHSTTEDAEVANWVKSVLERKAKGEYGTIPVETPPMHKAPLGTISPVPS